MNPEFSAVDIDYAAVAPMLIVVAGALIGVVVEAFAPRRSRHGIQVGPGSAGRGHQWLDQAK